MDKPQEFDKRGGAKAQPLWERLRFLVKERRHVQLGVVDEDLIAAANALEAAAVSSTRRRTLAVDALEQHMAGNRQAATFAVVSLDFAHAQAEAIDHLHEELDAALSATATTNPEEILEWLWHLDLHQTEHDLQHAGKALRAAWPHVRAYLDRLVEASATAQKLMYETAGYCRLSVFNVQDNRMEEQAVKLDAAARNLGATPDGSGHQ